MPKILSKGKSLKVISQEKTKLRNGDMVNWRHFNVRIVVFLKQHNHLAMASEESVRSIKFNPYMHVGFSQVLFVLHLRKPFPAHLWFCLVEGWTMSHSKMCRGVRYKRWEICRSTYFHFIPIFGILVLMLFCWYAMGCSSWNEEEWREGEKCGSEVLKPS